ncbi:hypothetical protein PsAD14_05427 [Pseudovibrio sp. Ad14]|nr:hypothetical protein PsW74_05216 [Pseudovibrio sp. W74]KZL04364.1 hypothetical protein PsAD14_05427 [Pseudovibrio sp. Ad14]
MPPDKSETLDLNQVGIAKRRQLTFKDAFRCTNNYPHEGVVFYRFAH